MNTSIVDQKLALASIKALMKEMALTGFDRRKIGKIAWKLRAFSGAPANSPLRETLNKLNRLLPNVKNGEIDYSWFESQIEKIEQTGEYQRRATLQEADSGLPPSILP
jgi:ABC-type transport system involved in cytochrome bd biosynthesis fused ATPase/permease subunit